MSAPGVVAGEAFGAGFDEGFTSIIEPAPDRYQLGGSWEFAVNPIEFRAADLGRDRSGIRPVSSRDIGDR